MAPGKVVTWLPKKKAFTVKTPEGTPPLHALILLSGHRGAGKGVAMTSLLRHYRAHGCADRIWWISPTIGSNRQYLDELHVRPEDRLDGCDNADLDTVVAGVEEEAAAWQDYQDKVKTYRELHAAPDEERLSPETLVRAERYGLLDTETAEPPKSRYGHKPVLHLVIDDCMGSQLMSPGPRSKLTNFAIKHRHIGDETGKGFGISVWLCVQSWSAQGSVPRPLRENATGVVVFATPHEKQLDKMAEELSDRRGPELFLRCYREATDPDHGFLFVDVASKDARYRAGWNKVLA